MLSKDVTYDFLAQNCCKWIVKFIISKYHKNCKNIVNIKNIISIIIATRNLIFVQLLLQYSLRVFSCPKPILNTNYEERIKQFSYPRLSNKFSRGMSATQLATLID